MMRALFRGDTYRWNKKQTDRKSVKRRYDVVALYSHVGALELYRSIFILCALQYERRKKKVHTSLVVLISQFTLSPSLISTHHMANVCEYAIFVLSTHSCFCSVACLVSFYIDAHTAYRLTVTHQIQIETTKRRSNTKINWKRRHAQSLSIRNWWTIIETDYEF